MLYKDYKDNHVCYLLMFIFRNVKVARRIIKLHVFFCFGECFIVIIFTVHTF